MRYSSIITVVLATISRVGAAYLSSVQIHLSDAQSLNTPQNISLELFAELEELSRIVDISYCVGTTGISKPFACASRCDEFPKFELVDTFNTGPMMSDSCGYVVLDHGTGRLGVGRILIAFRGTYSIANTIVDLSTVPQEYVPYPGTPDNSSGPGQPSGHHKHSSLDLFPRLASVKKLFRAQVEAQEDKEEIKCLNCTVHTGFWTSWQNTRPSIIGHIEYLHEKYPQYRLDLVGHSLGGAVAALAGLEFDALGYEPTVTTFGEPKVGNSELRNYIDGTFALASEHRPKLQRGPLDGGRYRRVTHADDPVPLLPLQEWGYRSHAGEVFISKPSLQPGVGDIQLCFGDEDMGCIAGGEVGESWFDSEADTDAAVDRYNSVGSKPEFEAGVELQGIQKRWGVPIPARYKIWQLFFAHRDYFWRLGLCVPGGDPFDWGRDKYKFGGET